MVRLRVAESARFALLPGKTRRGGTRIRPKKYFRAANPSGPAERLGRRDPCLTMEKAMRRTLIRYKTKPEASDRNAELISAVFAELKAAKPDGVRYLSIRLDDDTFIHLVESTAEDGSSPIPKLVAFQAFQSGIRERCVEPPQPREATIVGNYRMLEN
jgi:hypothetical protein